MEPIDVVADSTPASATPKIISPNNQSGPDTIINFSLKFQPTLESANGHVTFLIGQFQHSVKFHSKYFIWDFEHAGQAKF